MPEDPTQPAQTISGFTTADAVERVMGAGYVASRESQQASEVKRLKGVAMSLATVIDTAGAIVAEPGFKRSAMAFANHTCSMLECERVGVGMLRSKTTALSAISHTSRVDRSAALVRRIEEAMNESIDQDSEIVVPVREDLPVIARQHERLAQEGNASIVTLPLRHEGEPVGTITLEREKPFIDEEIAAARMLAELVTPRMVQLHQTDRWFGARIAASLRRFGAVVVGPRHTWAKLGALAGFALIVFAIFFEGAHQIKAPCTIKAGTRAIVAAPFDARIREVFATVGDEVEPGEPLLLLDDSELRLQRSAAVAELDRILGEVAQARAESDLASLSEAQLRADQARADIALLDGRLTQAQPVAPIGGTLTDGRWQDRLGAPVARGDTLFDIAPLDQLRVELRIDGRDIGYIEEGQRGTLALAAFPARRVPFTVERILPFGSPNESGVGSIFLVRATLDERPEWLRSGMEGAARVEVGERRYAWLWTHRATDWARQTLWW